MFTKTLAWALTTALLGLAASSQAFPEKTITLVVPFSPGTTTDVNAREFGLVLASITKQQVLIDNRVGTN